MREKSKRLVALFLSLVLVLVILPTPTAFAVKNDSEPMETVKQLLNAQELHPQVTGYRELDAAIEKILAPYAEKDTYTKIKAAYDWCVTEINFSWQAYSQDYAPAYDKHAVKCNMTYENGLQEAVPWEIANRSYYTISNRAGVCYDYAAVFCVMARYIGIDAYVHTGYFEFEGPGYGTGKGHHGWTELVLNGTNYIFDPQRDYRLSANGTATIPYNYFGITYANAWRYAQETDANAKRDAQFLSVTAPRERVFTVKATATASGSVTGAGEYKEGETVTLTAASKSKAFIGWFDTNAKLLTTEPTYTFTAKKNVQLKAVFAGEFFTDVKTSDWFYEDIALAGDLQIVNGVEPFVFSAETKLTRSMAVTILARAVGAQTDDSASPFKDVPAGEWFTGSVAWAKANNVVKGTSSTHFSPDDLVTREQFITILMRYIESQGHTVEGEELKYTDSGKISDFALDYMEMAQAAGLVTGYTDGSVKPQGELTRSEGVTLLMRTLNWLENANQTAGESLPNAA